MKILILSFYYYPDLCAGSFRCTSLVKQLQEVMPEVELDIITTLPNRYASFNPEALEFEEQGNVRIYRVALPHHRSKMLAQAKAFLHYANKAIWISRGNQYNLIYATSSRLMTSVLGAFISKKKNTLLYLDIRDLFVDTICDVFPKNKSLILRPFFSFLERWSFKSAKKINLVSLGFKQYIENRYSKAELSFFTNGIDDEFVSVNEEVENHTKESLLTIIYAGNIGEGQGLHHIIPKLAKELENKVLFKIVGDGGKLDILKDALEVERCRNVELIAPVDRMNLLKFYKEADVLFLHLNDHKAFKKVLPSKLFEYAALGKPIWAGVGGYPAEFIKNEISNAAVFTPGNSIMALEVFNTLKLQFEKRESFIRKYQRKNIMREMSQDIKATLYSSQG